VGPTFFDFDCMRKGIIKIMFLYARKLVKSVSHGPMSVVSDVTAFDDSDREWKITNSAVALACCARIMFECSRAALFPWRLSPAVVLILAILPRASMLQTSSCRNSPQRPRRSTLFVRVK
jgi:hypothetical protein